MLPAGQSTDNVCGEAPRLASEKEDVENDASVRFSLGFVEGTFRSKELLLQGTKSPRSFIDAMCHVRTVREIRSDHAPKVREIFDNRNGSATIKNHIRCIPILR
jgi:hypothetical protein